jgi:ankyrin repeat protein
MKRSRRNIVGPSSTLILIVALWLHFIAWSMLISSLPVAGAERSCMISCLYGGGLLSVIGFVVFYSHMGHYGITEKVINVLLILITGTGIIGCILFSIVIITSLTFPLRVAVSLAVITYGVWAFIKHLTNPANHKQADPVNTQRVKRWALVRYVLLGALGVMPVFFLALPRKSFLDRRHLPPLHLAARHGSATEATHLIDSGADVNALDFRLRSTALHWAALKGHLDVVEVLLNKGGDIQALDRNAHSLLHYAAQEGRREMVAYLLKQRLDPRATSKDGDTPLHCVGKGGDDVTFLAGKLPDNAREKPMPSVASGDRAAIAAMLLAGGADIEARNRYGYTPLHCAAMGSDTGVVRLLLDKGAKVNGSDGRGFSPLHFAVLNGPVESVEMLLDAGADIESREGSDGETPLIVASRGGPPGMYAYLLSKGARLDLSNNGIESLHLAAVVNKPDVVSNLLARGIDVNSRDASGQTALHHASNNMHPDMVAFLLEQGADAKIVARNGESPLTSALKRVPDGRGAKHIQTIRSIASSLIEHGLDASRVSLSEMEGAEDIPATRELKAFLLKHGAKEYAIPRTWSPSANKQETPGTHN